MRSSTSVMSSTCSKRALADVDGALLGGGEGEAIAGAGVDFDDLAGEFVLLLQDQPGKVGRVLQLGNDDALDGDAEALEDALHEVVGERALLGSLAQEHPDDGAHVRLDVDDEDLLVIAHEEGAPAVGGQDAPNLHRNHIVLHVRSLGRNRKKTSPRPTGISTEELISERLR